MRYQPACVIERWRPEQIPTPTTKYWQEQNQPTGRHFIQCCHIDRLIPPPRPQIQSAAFQFNPFKWFHLPHSISRWNALGWVGMGIPLPAVGHFHPFPSISIHFHPFPSISVGFSSTASLDLIFIVGSIVNCAGVRRKLTHWIHLNSISVARISVSSHFFGARVDVATLENESKLELFRRVHPSVEL